MRLLRKSRSKWSDRDVYAAADKLQSIGIREADELLDAVEAELRGQANGVNQRLLQQGHRSFAEKTLKAILRQAQEVCSENQPPEEERHSSFQRPSHGAFSRQALKTQQVFSYQEEATEEASKAKVAEELPGTTGLKAGFLLSTKEVAEAPEERSDAAVGFRWKREHPTVQEVPPVRLESPESTGGYKDEVAPEEVLVYCPKQHALRWEGAPYDMDCDRCGAEISTGDAIWWCGLCGYDLCPECHAEKAV